MKEESVSYSLKELRNLIVPSTMAAVTVVQRMNSTAWLLGVKFPPVDNSVDFDSTYMQLNVI